MMPRRSSGPIRSAPSATGKSGWKSTSSVLGQAFDRKQYQKTLDALNARASLVAEPADLSQLRGWAYYHLGNKQVAKQVFQRLNDHLSDAGVRARPCRYEPDGYTPMKRVFPAIALASILASCSSVVDDPFLRTGAVEGNWPSLATTVSPEYAVAALPGLPATTVRQTGAKGKVEQTIVYANATDLAGENVLSVTIDPSAKITRSNGRAVAAAGRGRDAKRLVRREDADQPGDCR
jgi:hypothetical protein